MKTHDATGNNTIDKFVDMMMDEHGAGFTAGYLNSIINAELALLSERKRKEHTASIINRLKSALTCQVTNKMTGELVTIRLSDRCTVSDPSMDSYWTG